MKQLETFKVIYTIADLYLVECLMFNKAVIHEKQETKQGGC